MNPKPLSTLQVRTPIFTPAASAGAASQAPAANTATPIVMPILFDILASWVPRFRKNSRKNMRRSAIARPAPEKKTFPSGAGSGLAVTVVSPRGHRCEDSGDALGRVHMFGPETHAHQARRNAPQEGKPVEQLHEEGRLGISLQRQHASHDAI